LHPRKVDREIKKMLIYKESKPTHIMGYSPQVMKELVSIKQMIIQLDKKIENFMGFFELSEEEREEIRKDVEAFKKGELEVVEI